MGSRHHPPHPLFILLPLLLSSADSSTDPSQCTSLLNSFSSSSPGLNTWRLGTDCCSWDGVTCRSGLVTALDLSNRSISGNISTALFNLTSLSSLNLAYNRFDGIPIPDEIGLLANLTSLNLSNAGFVGQIPIGVAKLTNLVSLDLSTLYYLSPYQLNEVGSIQLVDPDFGTLIGNMSGLRELYLDGANISANGYQWGAALAKSTPRLQVLSLIGCLVTGPIDSSLVKLRHLSVIRLDQNELGCDMPDFLGNFSSLSVLRLRNCHLFGEFLKDVFLLKNLTEVDLSQNLLSGSLPEFSDESNLESLVLYRTFFSGYLPKSIGKVKSLTKMDLSLCKFLGEIPSSIDGLSQLIYLDFSMNNFSGAIPSVLPPGLTELILAENMLTGSIPSSIGKLRRLVKIDLRQNSLSGQIPASLFTLPSLQELTLNLNKLSGRLQNFSSSQLVTVDLSNNNLQGEIPRSVFRLSGMNVLKLASNNFSGTVELKWISGLRNLSSLDLSYNRISMRDEDLSPSVSFPSVVDLALVSCNLTSVPSFLRFQNQLSSLDLSNNKIGGAIPNWIWSIGTSSFDSLNLSHNLFTSVDGPMPDFDTAMSINTIDLHSNLIQGPIPLPTPYTYTLDYSDNNFSSSIPSNISLYLSLTSYLSLANNKIVGEIPPSICNASRLQFLDFSKNLLNGPIPPCIFEFSSSLTVLNLSGNRFQGTIPTNISETCGLKVVTLNSNELGGQIPRSLTNCSELEILDLGNNHLTGSFPFWIGNIQALQVLILRSNEFYGHVVLPPMAHTAENLFSQLQIFDISSNHFNGTLPLDCFKNLKGMMLPISRSITVEPRSMYLNPYYDKYTVTVTSEGVDMTLSRLMRIFTSLDFSNNRFEGNLPDVGQLVTLMVLNFSHNALTGSISPSVGNLIQLESLDLSGKQLSGQIPQALCHLTFLSFLNLSSNNLVGQIPFANQLSTFSNSSFSGNAGLCGNPLSKPCSDKMPTNTSSESPLSNSDGSRRANLIGLGLFTGMGFGLGIAAFLVFQSVSCRFWKKRNVNRL